MDRRVFKEEMEIHVSKVKELFFAEYWSDYCCLNRAEEQKLLSAIRKINSVLEGMQDEC